MKAEAKSREFLLLFSQARNLSNFNEDLLLRSLIHTAYNQSVESLSLPNSGCDRHNYVWPKVIKALPKLWQLASIFQPEVPAEMAKQCYLTNPFHDSTRSKWYKMIHIISVWSQLKWNPIVCLCLQEGSYHLKRRGIVALLLCEHSPLSSSGKARYFKHPRYKNT